MGPYMYTVVSYWGVKNHVNLEGTLVMVGLQTIYCDNRLTQRRTEGDNYKRS